MLSRTFRPEATMDHPKLPGPANLIEAARKLDIATTTATIGQSGASKLPEAIPDQRELAVNAL
jgi:hypothetical protein